jgi:cell division septation protein DedD
MAARQGRRQLQFTGFEMGMIAVSFVVTVTAVFFLGLFVGKKNASWHAPAEERIARVPVDDFTRYKRPAPIEKPVREAKAVDAAASPTGAAEAKAAIPGTAPEVAKQATPASPAPPAAESTPTAAPSAARPGSPAGAAQEAASPEVAAKEAAKARELAAAKEAAAKKAKEEKEREQAEASKGKGYTVQILATRKQADADALVQKLKSRGYAAYIKKVSDGAGAWYRVRVGSYGAFSEAKGMADKCRRDLSLGQAFVSTE